VKIQLKKQINESDKCTLKKYSDFLANLLLERGFTNEEEADSFLNPKYELNDPFLLPDMSVAVERLIKAIERKEKILVFADYDADGIPGAALFADFLSQVGAQFNVIIPNRGVDGFGLNKKAIEEALSQEARLVITIDCGITDVAEAALAKSCGIDLIITDHHDPIQGQLPQALAIINPKLSESKYPEKNLCGAAVIFRFVEAILKKERFGVKEGQEKWLLDLVGIATIADQVPLLGENRILASFGLKVLRKTRRAGLLELFSRLKLNPHYLSEDDIAFSIAPRINAASRMGDPFLAFTLLRTQDLSKAKFCVDELEKLNDKRKTEIALIVKDIKKRFDGLDRRSFLFTGHSGWRPALLGLAASMIAEEIKKPVFLWGKDDELRIKGSFRSNGKLDVLTLIRESQAIEMFSEFGGHSMAGGFTISDEKIHFIEDSLNVVFDNIKSATNISIPSQADILADKKIAVEDLNENLWREINQLSPFGQGNEKPILFLECVRIGKIKKIGKTKSHIMFDLIGESGNTFPAIIFFFDDSFSLKEGERVSIAGYLEKAYFNSSATLRLRVIVVESQCK
jgi:single-stranded-DNA-specific exonuclease